MKKALELLHHYEGIFDMNMFFNVTVTEGRIDFMGYATKENIEYFKEKGYVFEYNNSINMLFCISPKEFGIAIRIILALN